MQPKPAAPKPVAKVVEKVKSKPAPKAAAVAPAPKPLPAPVVAEPAVPAEPTFAAPVADQVRMSPIGGSELPIEKVPSGVSTVSTQDVTRQGASTIQDVLAAKVPGISLNDLQGSGFQTDIQYRGFQASPVDGVAQGLAVYQNGVRINEAFGDTVNLDLIPQNAIADITVFPNNPAFGLNALGGAVSIGMKDGFNTHGSEIDARFGSFGRRQFSLSTGQQVGPAAIFAAYEDIHDDGWRDFSPTHIKRFYGDIGFKDGENELHFNITRSDNFYGVVAATPLDLLSQQGWNRVWTSPQTTENTVTMPTVNATVKLDNATKLSGVAYYRNFSQRHADGNPTDADDCGGFLCDDGGAQLTDQHGNPIASTMNGVATGEIDGTRIDSDSYGASAQIVNKSKLFGHGNQFVFGASYDRGTTRYQTSAEFGPLDPYTLVVGSTGIYSGYGAATDYDPNNIRAVNQYAGVFVSDTFDVTHEFAITAGGRYNYANINLQDLSGVNPELDGTHTYERFNPMVGATYKLTPGTSVYASYSEANRAPVAAELSCADPTNPCIIPSFLTSDPDLKQVVAHSYEAGLRGQIKNFTGSSRIDWNFGAFLTLNQNDIYPVLTNATGTQGYFVNAGDTLRKGIEASLTYRDDRLMVYGSYSYTDATFESANLFSSPNAPQNEASCAAGGNCSIQVNPGDHIPGVPQHKVKLGIDYWMTPKWKVGGDMVAQSSQYFFGDESNQNKQLGGFATFNLHTSYDFSKNIQVYGLINNLFDARYGTYGAYVNTMDASAPGGYSAYNISDARSITPAMPFAAYGGLKVKF